MKTFKEFLTEATSDHLSTYIKQTKAKGFIEHPKNIKYLEKNDKGYIVVTYNDIEGDYILSQWDGKDWDLIDDFSKENDAIRAGVLLSRKDNNPTEDLINKVNSVINTMRSSPRGRGTTVQRAELQGNYVIASIRYWGTWEIPDDEEDDGDYDWKELSQSSKKELNDIIQKANKNIGKNKLEYEISEKDYINISIKYK